MLKINYNSFFRIILILSAIKIIFSIYLGDEAIDMEWGIINQNLVNFGEFSYYEIDSNRIPSIYMPPLYSYFLYSFSFFNLDQFFTTKLIIITQCLLSLISALVFFRLLRNYFDDEKAYIVSILYYIFPINFYAASQISSVSLQVFCFIYFIYFLINLRSTKDYILLGLFSSFLILIRGEFWLLFILMIFFKIFTDKKKIKKLLITLIVTICVISPVIIKNYKIFDKLIITKSFGYNLWRGNSEPLNINGNNFDKGEMVVNEFIRSGININKFELYRDNFFLQKAKKNLIDNPYMYINHYLKKFFAFSIFNFDSNYPNYYNPLIFIPEIIISLFAFFGILLSIFKNKNYDILILILYYLALIPIFFILPRYKLFILPLYFIFASQFYFYLSNIFSKKQ